LQVPEIEQKICDIEAVICVGCAETFTDLDLLAAHVYGTCLQREELEKEMMRLLSTVLEED
jgi:hypothetical protein